MKERACRVLPALLCALWGPVVGAQEREGVEVELPRWRNIGPANMMGRIAAIEAHPEDHRFVVVGSASGGVFLSENGGVTWTSIFDDYGACSIGAVAFHPKNRDVIWVGTGEAANRNSVGWGNGLWKSTNRGKTFSRVGLEQTQQIAEIALHPEDLDVAYVAAVGPLWADSPHRGLFKTVDGGESWEKLGSGLPESERLGCTEVILRPGVPETVFCGMYERRRQPWSMQSGGPLGGMFRSDDAGATWRKVTDGLPKGPTGMIDIAICLSQPDVVVANVEADHKLPDDLSVPGSGVYVSQDGGDSWTYRLRHNVRPFYHGQIDVDPNDPERIFVVSREFKVSLDGGKSWRDRWWQGGGDDHDFWMSPQDSKVWYMATDQGAYGTVDDGATVVGFENMAIGQYYAIAADMADPYHVMGGLQDNGLWYGPSNSREPRGILNAHNTWVGEGDGFHCAIDPRDNRTIYMVNHVGFCARLDVLTREHAYITPTPETILNYDDVFDPDHPDEPIRYTIYPGEHWFFGARDARRPKLPPQFRFNWSSPLVLSLHDPDVVYFAGNYLFESRDRGTTWRIVSPDLTTDDPGKRAPSNQGGLSRNVTGGENHCTVVTIAVSPLDPRVLWTGSDDGALHVTRDGGAGWNRVDGALPGVCAGSWISRVEPSRFVAGRCYVAVDDHRRGDMRPMLFVTDDFGVQWQAIASDLPQDGSVYVVREDVRNPDLLFCGTEFGCFCSLDRGGAWRPMDDNLPKGLAVHDLVIHPRDMDLIAGTHGRSIWIADDITALQQWTPEIGGDALHVFAPRPGTQWRSVKLGRKQPSFLFRGENPPRGTRLSFSLGQPAEDVEVVVESLDGTRRWRRRMGALQAGGHSTRWNLQLEPSEVQVANQRALVAGALDYLEERVGERSDQQGSIESLRGRLAVARGARGLEGVRYEMVQTLGAWADGRPRFGEPVVRSDAQPGTYRVVVRANVAGQPVERTSTVVVRSDPLTSGANR